MSRQKQCVTCNKNGGILICDGCQKTFCGIHVIEHRQELAHQLDGIMQEHDLLQQEFTRLSDEHVLLENIDKWEQESITKIKVAAKTARADLQQVVENSKEQFSKACYDIAANLRSSRQADDFSEHDLSRWMQQLKEIKVQITLPSSVQIIEDGCSVIPLISIRDNSSAKKAVTKNRSGSTVNYDLTSVTQERFSKVNGDGKIDEQGLVAKCSGAGWQYLYLLGQQHYSQGRHTVRFKIELSGNPYNMFFGCISSQAIEKEIHFYSPLVVGWFGCDEIYQHGSCQRRAKDHGYRSDEIKTNNMLQLTFNCEEKQIELFQEQTNRRYTLAVNIDRAPFPWQLLLVLTHPNDCVRIML
jgi:hypothetical protein